jgi:hypothetical protein
LLCAAAFIVLFFLPIIDGCDQTIWQTKVPLEFQGRIFAFRGIFVLGAMPVAAVLGGYIAERYFEPWMMPNGLLADTFGIWLGVGKGRGVGLMFVLAGTLCITLASLTLMFPCLRRLDSNLPDAH